MVSSTGDKGRKIYKNRRFQSFEFWAESLQSRSENIRTKFSETNSRFGLPMEKYPKKKKKSAELEFGGGRYH